MKQYQNAWKNGFYFIVDYFSLTYQGRRPDWEQDWEFMLCDPNRVQEFISSYNSMPGTHEKILLMQLTISSYDVYLCQHQNNKEVDDSIYKIASDDWDLHKEMIKYWSLIDSPEGEGEFAVTQLMLGIWRKLSKNSSD